MIDQLIMVYVLAFKIVKEINVFEFNTALRITGSEINGISPICIDLGLVSLRLMTSQFKDVVSHTHQLVSVKCIFCSVWVEPIHRKICILRGVEKLTNYDILELWHIKSQWDGPLHDDIMTWKPLQHYRPFVGKSICHWFLSMQVFGIFFCWTTSWTNSRITSLLRHVKHDAHVSSLWYDSSII